MGKNKFNEEMLKKAKCIKQGPPKTYELKFDEVGRKPIYIKEFANEKSALKVKEGWDAADIKGIPMPKYGIQELNGKYYFWTEKCKGTTLFKAAISATVINNWLNMHTDIEYLTRLKAMFNEHDRGDAQGLFENEANGAIEFIDLGNPVVAVPQMQQFIPTVEARIKFLKAEASK